MASLASFPVQSFNPSIMSLSADSGNGSNEKNTVLTHEEKAPQNDPTDIIGDHGGHVLDVNQLGAEKQGLQTAPDGKTILIPQPSSDPNDPLNWSVLKKHVILLVITVVAFLPDFGSSMGVVALLPQAM